MIATPTPKFINVKGQLMDLSSPKVMGIINVTPDSFYDGGQIRSDSDLLKKAEKMLEEGADVLDVGAYSSRPRASDVAVEDEKRMAAGAVATLIDAFPEVILSIDSFRAQVAKACLDSGACMINDISGGELDNQMFDLVVGENVPYIMMHMRGTPKTMSEMTDYDDLTMDIMDYFNRKINSLTQRGVSDIILDPGFGFAKSRSQNFELINKLELFRMLDVPMLCGVSRKSIIFKTLGGTAADALNGTTALNMACLMKGASILRVHDVKEAKETVALYDAIKQQN